MPKDVKPAPPTPTPVEDPNKPDPFKINSGPAADGDSGND